MRRLLLKALLWAATIMFAGGAVRSIALNRLDLALFCIAMTALWGYFANDL